MALLQARLDGVDGLRGRPTAVCDAVDALTARAALSCLSRPSIFHRSEHPISSSA
ncbi:hypothetical protein [Ornithinimicrobium kibberense]|uniref:hypothetical protein n=1 Tax=Ornithinimicrobium kibberense TaxID=282060 RepID=UPI003609896B